MAAWILDMGNKPIFYSLLCAASLALASPVNASGDLHPAWGRTTSELIQDLSRANTQFEEISLQKNPGYRNRMIDFIVKVDAELREKITVIRARTDPEKDYLFLSGRLFSVRERYGDLSQERFDSIAGRLRSAFGEPVITEEKKTTVHSYAGRGTKAILRSRRTPAGVECIAYYYDSNLFRIMFRQ